MIKRFLLPVFIIFIATGNYSFAQITGYVSAKHGIVTCSEKNASEIGLQVLQKGGNAIDAAVAMSFALAVTYPGAGNIGGGGFLLYYRNDGMITSIDFREKAPLSSYPTMYLDEQGDILNNSNNEGMLSVGVPGTVAGLELASKKYGRLPWGELVEPAINLAENGFTVSQYLSNNFQYFKDEFLNYPSSSKKFLKENGSIYLSGDVFRQPDLARTLKRIQKYGKEDFYNGITAELICECMEKNGGLINRDDLEKYFAIERKPIHCGYRGYDIYSMGLPSSGGIVLTEMLNILEGYNLHEMVHNSAPYLHILTEAMRLAYLDRALYLGDIDFNPDIPFDMLISKEYASKQRDMIKPDISNKSNLKDIKQLAESPHTTHFSVMDKEGNAVSLTYTLGNWLGSKIVVDGAGFLLNNEMCDFNPKPNITDNEGNIGTEPNVISPGKRMLSSMTPTIVLKNNQPFLVIGSPGGRTIPNTVLQVILNVIDFNMDIYQAISQKRIHHQWMPDITSVEEGIFSDDSLKEYEEMGHEITEEFTMIYNEAMGILVDTKHDILYGAADPRSPDGLAVGY